jgi:hypothetical protein
VTAVAGLIVGLCGLGLALNVLHAADNLAAINRNFPWWMKSPVADYAIATRATGAVLALLGLALFVLAMR